MRCGWGREESLLLPLPPPRALLLLPAAQVSHTVVLDSVALLKKCGRTPATCLLPILYPPPPPPPPPPYPPGTSARSRSCARSCSCTTRSRAAPPCRMPSTLQSSACGAGEGQFAWGRGAFGRLLSLLRHRLPPSPALRLPLQAGGPERAPSGVRCRRDRGRGGRGAAHRVRTADARAAAPRQGHAAVRGERSGEAARGPARAREEAACRGALYAPLPPSHPISPPTARAPPKPRSGCACSTS